MLAGFTPQWLQLSAGGEINVCSFHTERKGTKFTVHHPVSVMVLLLPGTTNGFLLAGVVLVLNAAREDELLCKSLATWVCTRLCVLRGGKLSLNIQYEDKSISSSARVSHKHPMLMFNIKRQK